MSVQPACWGILIATMCLAGCAEPAAESGGLAFTFQVANSTGEPRLVQVLVAAEEEPLVDWDYSLVAHSKSKIEEHAAREGQLRIEVTTGALDASRTIDLVDGVDALVVLVRDDVVEILHMPRPKPTG